MEKMFRPSSRRRAERTKDTFEFKLHFRANRVPNSGWEKLMVSLIPVETGRPSAKTTRVHVRNGICQWPDPIIEKTRIIQDPSTKEYDEKLYRLVVATGSLRSGVLGETNINLADFINSNTADDIALVLKNCNAGTVLHVKIQCLTPKNGSRDVERRRESGVDQDDQGFISDEDDDGSDLSENLTTASAGSSTSQHLSGPQSMQPSSGPMKDGTSLAASQYSSDSWESNSTRNAGHGNGRGFSAVEFPRRQDSGSSQDGVIRTAMSQDGKRFSYSQISKNQGIGGDPSKGWHDSYAQQTEAPSPTVPSWDTPDFENGIRGHSGLSQKGNNYGRTDLEAAETTIQELRTEAVTWERHARNLNLEVETLKQQLTVQLRSGANFGMEMSALEAECDSLKLEIAQLKAEKRASEERESGFDHAWWEAEDVKNSNKELQEELAYEKDANHNLGLQLHKTQESNLELVSAITELEETVEQQSRDIQRLTEQNQKLEDSLEANEVKGDSDAEWRNKLKTMESEWMQEVMAVETELMQRLEGKDREVKQLEAKISSLLSDTEQRKGLESEDIGWRERLISVEKEWMQKLKDKDEEMKIMKAKVSSLQSGISTIASDIEGEAEVENLHKTIVTLEREAEELERDCKELTDENIDLIHKLNTSNKDLESKTELVAQLEGKLANLLGSSVPSDAILTRQVVGAYSVLEEPELQSKVSDMEEVLRSTKELHGKEIAEKKMLLDGLVVQVKELEEKSRVLEQQLESSTEDIEMLRIEMEGKTREVIHRESELLSARELGEESTARLEKELAIAMKKIEVLENDQQKENMTGLLLAREEQLTTLEERAARLEEEHNNVLTKLSFVEAENASVKEQLRGMSETKEKMENFVDELQRQKEEMELWIQEFETDQDAARAQISEYGAEIAKLQLDIVSHADIEKNLEAQVMKRTAEVDNLLQDLGNSVTRDKNHEMKVEELERERNALESKVQDLLEARMLSMSRIEELEFQLPVLLEEIQLLNASKNEFESKACGFETEKNDLEEKLETAQEESNTAREKLEALEVQVAALTTTLESQLATNKIMERRASELESNKEELESQVTDLEEETLQLSERISGLEAQLRYVTEERELHKLEKENVQARTLDLQNEKSRLESSFQESVSEQQHAVSMLEEKLMTALKRADDHYLAMQKYEQEVYGLRDEITSVNQSKQMLEKDLTSLQSTHISFEQQLHDAKRDCTSYLATITRLEAEVARRQSNTDKMGKEHQAEIESLISLREDQQQRAKKAEENLRRSQWEKAITIERLQNELQRLTEQLSSTFDEKEKLASEALLEASELRGQKMELEYSVIQMQEKIRQVEEEASSLKEKLEAKLEVMGSEIDILQKNQNGLEEMLEATKDALDKKKAVEADDKLKIRDLEMRLSEEEHETQRILKENIDLGSEARESIKIKADLDDMRSKVEFIESEKTVLQASLEKSSLQCSRLQEERLSLVEKLRDLEAAVNEVDELRRSKAAMDEKLHRFQSLLEAQEAARIQEAEQRNELIRLKRQVSQFQRKMIEEEEEKDEFRRRVQSLEEELQVKVDALSRTEKQLKEREESSRSLPVGRSMSRSNSKVALSSPSRDSKEVTELRERLKSLEEEVKTRERELKVCNKDFKEREADLCNTIKHLELSNEQLAVGQQDSGLDELQREMLRLQKQNSSLSRKEQELLSKLNTQEILQKEVHHLKEANEKLETRLSRFMETVENPKMLEKVVTLETELAEALEATNMYKSQLKSVFSKQQNVNMAALQNLGDLDEVINELLGFKRRAAQLEVELQDMRERYTLMSLQFAEVEAERGELIMTIKSLKNSKKP